MRSCEKAMENILEAGPGLEREVVTCSFQFDAP